MEDKASLRKAFLQYRSFLSPQDKSAFDTNISVQILCNETYLSAQTVFCYVSLPQEINTVGILADAARRGKRIAVPRCRKNGEMDFCIVSSRNDLVPGVFGIPEPKESCSICVPHPDDLCIVPCLAADKRGFRLGYGGGYYDRYLAAHPTNTIGLCYSACITQTLPAEQFDVPLQMIVTDKEV